MLSSEFLLTGVAAPAATGFAAALALFYFSRGRRAVGAFAFAVAQALGTAIVLRHAPHWLPSRNLHWVPWIAVLSACVSPIVVAGGLAAIERWLLAGLASVGAAALLVPDWPELWPSRPISIACLAVAMMVISRGVDGIAVRLPPRLVAIALWGTSLAAAGAIADAFSLKLGESALITASALAGVTAAILFRPDPMTVRGLALTYGLAIAGWCYVIAVEPTPPTPPIWGLMTIPAAPLVLWLTAVGPLAKKSMTIRWIVSTLLMLVTLGGIVAWIHFSTDEPVDEYSQARYGTPCQSWKPAGPLFCSVFSGQSHLAAVCRIGR